MLNAVAVDGFYMHSGSIAAASTGRPSSSQRKRDWQNPLSAPGEAMEVDHCRQRTSLHVMFGVVCG